MHISVNIVRHLLKKVEVAGQGEVLQTCPDYPGLALLPAEAMIDADTFFRIIGHVNAHYPTGQLAHDIEYRHFSLSQINMLGALGQLVQVSPTFEDVSEAFYKYYGKLNSIFSPGVERRGEFVACKIVAGNDGFWQQRPFQVTVEMFLYGMMRIVKEWFDAGLAQPLSMTLPYLLPEAEKMVMKRTVAIEPLVGDGCYLLFRSEVFLQPLPFANPQLWEHLKKYMEQNAQQGADLMTPRLKSYLQENLKETPDLKTAAEHLSLSERSLQRRLQEENSSFQRVVDQVRLEQASQMLATGKLGVKEIASNCGFSDPNSFFRAFKKWTGQTPEQWRSSG